MMGQPYTLGIDVGIASLGYAGLSRDAILFAGVHTFDAAENPKDGSSLAATRREKRGMRRTIRRKAQRKRHLMSLFKTHLQVQTLSQECPWQLRQKALTQLLSPQELARVLYHIANRRGYQSNSKKAERNDKENAPVLKGAVEMEEAMLRAGKETIGAYIADLEKKRNGDGDYSRMVTRALLRDEVNTIFAKQSGFGNPHTTDAFLKSYSEKAFTQRPLQSFYDMVGPCTFFPNEKRAPKDAPTAEMFVLWSKLHNLRIISKAGAAKPITLDKQHEIVAQCYKTKGGVTYKAIRKLLGLEDSDRFNISYRRVKEEHTDWYSVRSHAESAKFMTLKGYHALRSALTKTGYVSESEWPAYLQNNQDQLDEAVRILAFYNDDAEIQDLLAQAGFDTEARALLMEMPETFDKTLDLSLKAIKEILPPMQTGLPYDQACVQAGLHHSNLQHGNKGTWLPPFADIRNPVVLRSLAKCRKVINSVIKKYGMPERIIVELAREMGKNFKDRAKLERENLKNRERSETAKKLFSELTGEDSPWGETLLKYKLWKEQGGYCPYSGVYIEPKSLQDPVATQIDHILPYSRTWNNSYMNKVLCLADENQRKGNDTPVEYFNRVGRSLSALEGFIAQHNLPKKKAENLLQQELSRESESGFKDRNLSDTRYIARSLRTHLIQNLEIPPGKIQTRNGALTTHLRRGWGLPDKDRIANDRHHAMDAIIIAASTQGMVQEFAKWSKYRARQGREEERFPPKPWPTFRDDALAAVEGVFVIRQPRHKHTGAAHEDTIRSLREDKDGKPFVVQRLKLQNVTLAKLEKLLEKDRNQKLYQTLKQRLIDFGDKPDKAFAEPVYMPAAPGKKAPQIYGITIETSEKSGVKINNGLASNGDMVRTDVFCKDGKYYLCPLYVHDFAGGKRLPNKVVKAHKDESEWPTMPDDTFLFSLYPNDLVHIRDKKRGDIWGYFIGTHRGTGAITLRSHDRDNSVGKNGDIEGIGVQRLEVFHKYQIDILGNKKRIPQEARYGLAHSSDSKPSRPQPQEPPAAAA